MTVTILFVQEFYFNVFTIIIVFIIDRLFRSIDSSNYYEKYRKVVLEISKNIFRITIRG